MSFKCTITEEKIDENSFDNLEVLIKNVFCLAGDVSRNFPWVGVPSEDLVCRVPVELKFC